MRCSKFILIFLVMGCHYTECTASDLTQSKFDIRLGGDSSFTAGYVSQSYDNANGFLEDTDFANLFRLSITPSVTSDSGFEYGASLRIRAWMSTGLIDFDQSYIFLDSSLGRVELGVAPTPNYQYAVTAPSGFGTGGVLGDWSEGPTGWISNQNTFHEPYFGGGFNNITGTNWANRINYYSPRFFTQEQSGSGLMGMFSYTPQNTGVGTGVNRIRNITPAPWQWSVGQSFCADTPPSANTNSSNTTPVSGCAYKNVVEFDFRYDAFFNGVTISAGAGYEHGETPTSTTGISYNELSAYQLGIQLGFNGFLLGGSYSNAGRSAYAKNRVTAPFLNDQSTYTAGISYETGPVIFGFNYAPGQDAGDVTVPGMRNADL